MNVKNFLVWREFEENQQAKYILFSYDFYSFTKRILIVGGIFILL